MISRTLFGVVSRIMFLKSWSTYESRFELEARIRPAETFLDFLNYFQTKKLKLVYLSAQEELGALLWICFTPNKRFSFFLVKKNGPKIPQKNRSKKCERPL